MQDFTYKNNTLFVEETSLNTIADTYGTPCYVYSRAAITRNYLAYANALGKQSGKICYAVKANSNLAVLQVLANLGAGFDIVSLGELERVLRAGGKPENILFSGVGKTRSEMERALQAGIGCFNVESQAELRLLAETAKALDIPAPVSIRVNPDVDANTHPYISTGLKENKFGVAFEDAIAVYQQAHDASHIHVVGVDCHIGSQLTEISPFLDALERVLTLIDALSDVGIPIKHLDLGGGLGVTYQNETPPSIASYIDAIKKKLGSRNIELMFEPGRSIVANAGILLTEVLYLKPTEHKNFAIVDAAMNDNLRPSLYQAWQDIQPLTRQENRDEEKTWDIVGPICETGDFLGKDRPLNISPGDRLGLYSSGAYGFTMSSNYNSRGRPPEVMVDKTTVHLVRQREDFDDLVRGESLLPETSDAEQ